MARDIRIVEAERRPRVTERLEERARSLVQGEWRWDSSASTILTQEIALTLEHIERQRAIQSELQSSMALERFYVYRELVQQKIETHYRPYRPNSIENLKARLSQIDAERRRLGIVHEEAVERLHDRLLVQLLRHAQAVNGNNGNRNNSEEA